MKHIQRRFRRKMWLIKLFWMNHWMQVICGILAIILGYIIAMELFGTPKELITPLAYNRVNLSNIEVLAEEKKVEGKSWTGIASYYSRKGCLGCSKNFTMANGKPLVDENLTVAFNRLKLGRKVKITNLKNGESVVATVTDTGGFERHGRIVDLTVGTKNAIKCSDLCKVRIEEIL